MAARIPVWKGNMLNVVGRITLVKAMMFAIPIHTSMALGLSPWAIAAIDRLRRAFFWMGSDKASRGRCKVAWLSVYRPKDLGGSRNIRLEKSRCGPSGTMGLERSSKRPTDDIIRGCGDGHVPGSHGHQLRATPVGPLLEPS